MKIRVAMLVAVLLVGASAPAATAMTTGELLAQCEQLERAWVIQDKTVRFPGRCRHR
jgi:hypothetical protein